MARARPRASVMRGTAHDMEAASYEALQLGDIELLLYCWAQDEGVVCLHPVGPRLFS